MKTIKNLPLLFVISITLVLIAALIPDGHHAVSASVNLAPNYRVYLDPSINKKFVPISIPPGGISRLTVYVYNPNDYPLVNVAWTDQLDKLQPGITIANNPQAVTTCGGTVTAAAGSSSFSLSGGTVGPKVGAENGSCSVAVNVTSFTPGNLDNEFVPGDLFAQDIPEGTDPVYTFTNATGVVETLNVADLSDPTVTKSFTPATVWAGQRSRMRITVRNNDSSYPLTSVSITDALPDGMVLADPVTPYIHPNCGSEASLTGNAGDASVTLNQAEIPASTSCYFEVYITAAEEGSYTNTIPANSVSSYEQVTNPAPYSATLTVNGVRMTKSFSPTTILAGEGISTMTITIQNPYPFPLTDAVLDDPLPGSDLVYIPGTAATTCQVTGTPAVLTLSDSDRTLTLSEATIPAGVLNSGAVTPGSCTVTVQVTAPGNVAGGSNRNQIPVGELETEEEYSNTNSPYADLLVNPQSIAVNKDFSPTRFELGGQAYVVINLTNPTSTAVTNVNLTDYLPTGFIPVVPEVTASTCGGTVTVDAVSAPTSITLTNGTIPANSTCNFRALITTTAGATATTYTNTIEANAITGAGITNRSSDSQTVVVYPVNRGVVASKSYQDSNLPQPTGSNIEVRLNFTAPQDETLTGVTITDVLPAGLTISNTTGPLVTGCGTGYSLSAPTGGDTIQLTGGTINAGAQCRIRVWVTGALPGSYPNTMSPTDFTNPSGQTFPNPVSDTLILSDFRVQKSFFPATIEVGGRSTLTITLINENSAAMENVWLRDRLESMGAGEFRIAPEPNASTTCGGTLTADAGAHTITLNGGSIPGNDTCEILVDIEARSGANTSTNTIVPTDATAEIVGTGTPVNPRGNATAVLTIADMNIEVVKRFDPSAVFGGSSSRMSILLINPNDVPLLDIRFADFMPEGMEISLPMDIDTSTCGGIVTVAPDLRSFTYEGGTLAANRRCTVSLNATIRVNGNLVNTIPAGAVTTFNGISNDDPASSTLTNLPGVSVRKYFTPNMILADPEAYATLTIQFRNTGNAPVTNMGLYDSFPVGLVVADGGAPAPTNTCGGTFTPAAGDGYVELSGGGLAGGGLTGDVCQLTVSVESDIIGSYRNVIAEGDVTSDDPNTTNPDPAEDTLIVYGTPAMQIVKNVTSSGPYIENDTITYEIIVTNTGDISLPNVQVTDPGTDVVLGTCTPALGSSLAAGDSMTCAASHVVTAADILAGSFSNTAYGDSDRTDPVSDDEIVLLSGGPAMSINKRTSSTGPYVLGSTITYQIVVRNIGTITLNNVQVTDPGSGVVLGACTPVAGSSLAVGASMTCPATHLVTQADVDAGTFANTAYADSDETDPESDSVDVPISQYPGMSVYKLEASSGLYGVGDTITFDIVTKNTGNTTLINVTVTDTGTELPLGPCTINEDPTVVSLPTTLLVDDELYCEAYHVVTQTDVDAAFYTNTAVADSDQTDPQSDDETIPLVQIPMIDLTKTGTLNDAVVAPAGEVNAGDTITYAFTVENTGNVTLYDVSITDAVAGMVINGGPILSIAPGASNSTTFTGTYSLTQADIDAGTFTNTATVHSEDPVGNPITDNDDDTQTLNAAPEITLEKTGTLHIDVVAPVDRVDAGDTITYEFTVTNTGNVTLTDVTLADTIGGVTISGGPIASLAPGASDSTTFTGTYTLTQDDVDAGTFTNIATATGEDPDGGDVTGDDDDTQTLEADPGITLQKTGTLNLDVVTPDDRADVGDTITYAFTVTNTGNVTLTDVTIDDTIGGVTISGGPITLDPGESDSTTFTGSYTLTQTDVDAGTFTNTATVTAEDPDGGDVTDDDDDTQTLDPDPSVLLEKTGILDDTTVTPAGEVNDGDTITYTFTVTNTGNVTLTNLTLTDTIGGVTISGGPIASLASGASDSTTFTGSYTLTQADVDAGMFTNTATITGEDPDGGDVTDDDDDEQTLTAVPEITLEKTGTLNIDVVSPVDRVDAGDTITYAFTVTNTGNVTLTDITLADTIGGVTISGGPIASLAPGASDSTTFTGTYTLTQDDVDAGSFTNTATVTGDDPDGGEVTDDDDDTQTLEADPGITLQKTGTLNLDVVTPDDRADAGDTITYAFTVTNTGNVTLTDVTIDDTIGGVTISGGPITLDPGESDSTTFTGSYTLGQTDIDTGAFTNTATVTGDDPDGGDVADGDDDTQTWDVEPGITLVKTGTLNLDVVAPNDRVDEGDTITYAFTVTNTGNATLTDITLADTIGGVTIIGGPIVSLAPGASDSTTFTGTYTLTQADIDAGTFTNTATVTGEDPDGEDVTDGDDDEQTLVAESELTLEKTGTLNIDVVAPDTRVDAGDTISYTFTVTNTGNVTLTNIALADTIGGVTISGGPILSLAPGASDSTTFTGNYTLTQDDVDTGTFTNTASVTGDDPDGEEVTDDDDDEQTLAAVPEITLEKTGTLNMDVVAPDTRVDEGDTITYIFTVTNSGNVTLTDVTITDTIGGVTISGGPTTLEPGETDDTTFTGVYTLTQDDVDAGSFTNTATVTGEDPDGEDVTDADDDIQNFTEEDSIGVAKRVVGDPEEVSAGTWNVTYEILVGNYTNVSLTRIQVADDLLATFPPETVFTVLEVTSADFVLNPDFDGIPAPEGDINLLAEDVNSLAVGESGTITILVQVIPASGGPFDNTAIASGETPSGEEVQDESQDGDDPDPDDDGDPLNNNEPTPLDFGPNLFDPPYGIKLLNERNLPLLEWTMVWINDTNIVAINVIASDGIPEGTTFYDTGIESGYPLPTGDLPEGTVSTGVQCLDDSDTTTTTHCYYEGPTDEYPLGRIVWQGRLGPDLGVTDPEDALHEIRITFQVMIDRGVTQVTNTATVDVDRDGDGDTDDDGEQEVAIAEEIWNAARELPDTGFAPGVISWIPPQSPLKAYTDLDTIILEVPALKQSMEVVSVPLVDGEWDVTWLGNAAGHLAGSAFPTWQGNTVITAHVYDAFGRPGPFYNLKGLRYGDQVRIHAFGMTYTYEVREILLVDYNNMKAVMKHEELDWITLVTCEHYNALTGEYPFRRVVRAVLIQVVED